MSSIELRPIDRIDSVDRELFQQDYLHPRRPVVFTRLAERWPAMSRWTPDFFQSTYGDLPVKVYDASFAAPGESYMSSIRDMRFGEYLEHVLNEDVDLRMFLYNMAREIPALKSDVDLPRVADGFSKRFMFMFFGCRGSVTPIHYDIDMSHVFHTAIYGRKRITLFGPEESPKLYRHPFTVRSYIDVDAPDFEQFPKLADASGYQVKLEPGETLFIPCAFWHHVYYEEGGFAISLRCANERPAEWLRGWLNLLVVSPVDRVMNRLLAARWFEWKRRRAHRAADELPPAGTRSPS